MINWLIYGVEAGSLRPTIPDYALDMHTADGQAMGRGRTHFWEEGAKISPELPERDKTYYKRIMQLLEQGEM